MIPRWLIWTQQIQAIAQTGLHYARDPLDVERYELLHHIATEMMTAYSDADPEVITGLFQMEQGHVTPKVDVRGVVFQADQLLLVKERSTGKWTLPGGFSDVGESPAEATTREVLEESGYQVQPMRLLALFDRAKHAHPPVWFACYKVFVECQLIGGQPVESVETAGVGFFSRNALPELDVGRITGDQINRIWELHDCPELGAQLD